MTELRIPTRVISDAADEAASAFEARAKRQGLIDVGYAIVDSPVGRLLVAVTPKGLVRVAFAEETEEHVLEEL